MADIIWGACGAALILLAASDVFRSLLVPRASTRVLRLGPLLARTLFPAWHDVADRLPGHGLRQTMRAALAPLMLVLSLLVWAALLIIGFGLVFWALRPDFAPRFTSPGDAIFMAGTAFCTLGVTGTVSGTLARMAVVSCGLAGLAIVTVVATFLLSVQSGFGRRETLVLRLEAHVTLPPAGIAILETYAGENIVPRLAAFFEAWKEWSAEVAISHRAYPILLFFRSNDSRCEWLAALGAVLDAAALVDATIADVSPQVRAGAHFVLRTGTRIVRDMAEQIAARQKDLATLVDADRFDDHRDRLRACGYTVVEDRQAALNRFTQRRAGFAPSLGMLAGRLRIEVNCE